MAGRRSPSEPPYVTASQVGEYLFCHRAWWLHHIRGQAPAYPERLAHGRRAHAGHGSLVRGAVVLRRVALLLLLLALLLLALRWGLG